MTLLAAGSHLSMDQFTALFLSLAVLLAAARALGELARYLNQPAVLGEIIAGILLGPTILGKLAPVWQQWLFPDDPGLGTVMEGITSLAIALFLLVAGMEVDLSSIWRQGKTALVVSFVGTAFPFAVGGLAAGLLPGSLMGMGADAQRLTFVLFFATAISISALPVIARTLMDLNLYRTDLGMVTIAAAVFNDLAGWIIFALIMGLMTGGHGAGPGIGHTLWLTLGFVAGMLTLGRWLIHKSIPWAQAHLSWPGGVIGAALTLTLAGAAFTNAIGIHAIFGAFIVGVALGDSSHLREQTRATIHQFVSFFFAPIFFASIGLKVDFISHFSPLLVLLVLLVACVGKILGCGYAAIRTGMDKREAWALGFALNSRGAMEIILGILGLQAGLINEPLFVALVIMALVTSLISGPAMQRILRRPKPRRFTDFLHPKAFLPALPAADRPSAIAHLAATLAPLVNLPAALIEERVNQREQLLATGLPNGIAVPHARFDGLANPVVAIALSKPGIDFDSADGEPAHVVFFILTPMHDSGAQLEILADIARTFSRPDSGNHALQATSYTEFLALLRSHIDSPPSH